jgi:hypothetical protein
MGLLNSAGAGAKLDVLVDPGATATFSLEGRVRHGG